jgi:zinc protease
VPGIEWEYNWAKSNVPGISLNDVNALKNLIDIDQQYFALVTTKASDKLPTDAELKIYVDRSLAAQVTAYTEKTLPSKLLATTPKAGKVSKEAKDDRVGTTTWILSNGAQVTFKKTDFKNDEIVFSGYRNGGSSLYSGNDFMSADMSNNVVDEMGYGAFSNTDLGKFLTGKTVNVETWVDLYSDNISGSSSVKDFETAMQLLYLKCTAPRKDAQAFASFKDKQVQMMAQMKSNPQAYFSDSLNNFRYGNNPRMKQIHDAQDYESIKLDNAIAFYNTRFNSARGMHYFFVGNIPEATFKNLVETYIGGLSDKEVDYGVKDLHIDPIAGEHEFKFNAGTEPKSMVLESGYFYTPFAQPDELQLTVLSEVVNNRITDIIREKMSAIYGGGVGMSLQKYPKESFRMQSYLPCGPENAAKVRTALWDILDATKKPGDIKSDEITKAVETSIQKYRVGIKTNNYWVTALSKYDRYGLPTENIINYEARIKAITPDVLTATANKYLGKTNMVHATWMPVGQ